MTDAEVPDRIAAPHTAIGVKSKRRHFQDDAMFYTDYKLQFPVRVEEPDPVFAKALQQAIGGVEGEIRVAMQHMFQAWGMRGDNQYREMLLNTGAKEIGHIEVLATAVAPNLENAPLSRQEETAADPVAGAVLNGMNLRRILSTGLAALPVDATAWRSPCRTCRPAATSRPTCTRTSAEATGRNIRTPSRCVRRASRCSGMCRERRIRRFAA